MIDPVYTLTWPRRLFEWEAQQVLQSFGSENWLAKVEHLLREGFHDPEVAEYFETRFAATTKSWGTLQGQVEDDAHAWLVELLADDSRLQQYKEPVYWAERNSDGSSPAVVNLDFTFPQAFLDLVETFRDAGYFPKILPVICVDEYRDTPDTGLALRRATKIDIPWPMNPVEADALPEAALYSLVEYFHDQAARPRRGWFHNYNECGFHYEDFNIRSGQIVYRWRVNELLKAHNMPLRLGSSGEEQGRLVRHFRSPLDDLAAEQIARRAEAPRDEVAHAVRMYRHRNATLTDKRAAITLLFGVMEPKKGVIEKEISTKDASDLFHIANKFTFRHRDKLQKADYGAEFLDWIFWTNLATVRLLDDLAPGIAPGAAE